MRTKIKNFYCQDMAIENMSKDYKVIEMSAGTYKWMKIQIHRLKILTEYERDYKVWNKEAKHALRLLELAEERAESEWFTTKREV